MAKRSTFRTILRRAGPPAAMLIVTAFFGAYAVFGPNGALAYGDIKRQLVSKTAEADALDKKRAQLSNRVALLDPKKANPDLVDELVRRKLDVTDPDEVVVPLKPQASRRN